MSTRKLVRCGLVAALYVVLCMALQPLSFGAVQIRFAEALVLLPVFGAEYIVAVTLGCFLANLLGSPPGWGAFCRTFWVRCCRTSSSAPWPLCWPAL